MSTSLDGENLLCRLCANKCYGQHIPEGLKNYKTVQVNTKRVLTTELTLVLTSNEINKIFLKKSM